MTGAQPPRRVRERLRRRLPADLADEVLAELDARYQRIRAERGRLAATLWYRRQARGARSAGPRFSWLNPADWVRDARHGARKLLRRPAVATALVVSLAFGIGANAAIFSVVNRVLLQPLPYPEPEQLRVLHTELPLQGSSVLKTSPPEVLDLQNVAGIDSLGAIWFRPGALTDDVAEPEDIAMTFVSAGFLPTLGVEPAMGRWPTAAEDVQGGEEVILLAHHLWQRRYGGDPDIVGRRIEFDGVPHTVIGVMPEGFQVLLPTAAGVPARIDAWVPFGGAYEKYPRGWRVLTVLTRLDSEAGDADAGSALDALAAQLRDTHEEYAGSGLAWRLEPLQQGVAAQARPLLTLLLGAVAMMLLIVCANSINLLAAGMSEGRHELAVRAALGASTGRLTRQLAAESAVVVAVGAAAGMLLARWCIDLLPRIAPAGLPRVDEIALDGRVLAYVTVISAATVVLLSVAAALRLRSNARPDSLRGRHGGDGDAGQGLVRSGLVVFEVAVCLMLTIGLALILESFTNLVRVDPGFEPDGLSTVKISLVDSHYMYSGPEAIAGFYRQLEERLEDAAGIDATGATTLLPFDGGVDLSPYAYDTDEGPVEWGSLSSDYRVITPGFLGAIGARLLDGRDFATTDTLDSPPVVIVDDLLAAKAWPGERAVGQRLQVERFLRGRWEPRWAEVVGVVEHIRQDPARVGVEQVFQAHGQVPMRTMTVVLRGDADPDSLLRTVADAVREVDPDQPIQALIPMDEYVGDSRAPTRFALLLLGVFAGVAVLLALVGTYGVISYAVDRRTRELGIQLALGATPAKLRRKVIAQGAVLAGAGLALGIAGALALSRTLSGLLYGVGAVEPATYGVVAVLLGVVALAACYLPARRASRLDPVEALRAE